MHAGSGKEQKMNIAMILAGGTGTRVGASIPKQFIKIMDKPILAYTLEIFQACENIHAIEIVCHEDWMDEVHKIVDKYKITKTKWMVPGGATFQESVMNGVFFLRDQVARDDIVVVSFGVSPMTPMEDINDGIRVCKEHGNAIAAKDIDLCTCIKDDDNSTTQNLLRETIKGFSNPWTFRFGELCDSYEFAEAHGFLGELEPHTTSLYFALGKRLWFSQSTAKLAKITTRQDLDLFEGQLLLEEKRSNTRRKDNEVSE